ncbi:MAG: AMP-binding protein, partial [Actinobacteria bacterium]|nr:AMP-binding protein [Actinomycetota bacterium]
MTAPTPVWEPSTRLVEGCRMSEFARRLAAQRGISCDTYGELWRWSIEDTEGFWGAILDFFDVPSDGEREPVLASHEMPGARWFPNVSLNYAERLLGVGADDDPAIFHASELRELTELSRGELRAEVAAVAAWLRAQGVGRGDRVVAFMPNIPETVVAFLA